MVRLLVSNWRVPPTVAKHVVWVNVVNLMWRAEFRPDTRDGKKKAKK